MRAGVMLLALGALLFGAPARAGTRPTYGGTATVALAGPLQVFDPALATQSQDRLLASLVHQPPLARDAAGRLSPVLLEAVPQPEEGGTTFRLVLRDGLHFHDGTAVEAEDLAFSLRRLGDAAFHSPAAVLALPLRSIEVQGRAVLVHLAFPYPEWATALAEPAAAVVPRSTGAGLPPPGLGPFRMEGRLPSGGARLTAFDGHALGRPFLDRIVLLPMQRAARALEEGKVDLAFGAGTELLRLPPTDEVIALSPSRLALASVLEAVVDREGLSRWFGPEGAVPMAGLLPGFPALARGEGTSAQADPLALLYDPGLPGRRAVAERVQLRLHERGVEMRLLPLRSDEVVARMSAGFDLALLSIPVPSDPGLAAAAPLLAAGDGAAARELLQRAGAVGLDADAQRQAVLEAAGHVGGGTMVPLLRTRSVLGAARVPTLSGLQPGGSPADLAWAFREER